MKTVIGQDSLIKDLSKIFEIFKNSNAEIRPHFILTGSSGSGKSFTISELARFHKLTYFEINAAQLTKEGVSGNSLSKALSPLINNKRSPTIVFVDEFDKLFISGNSNSSLAHESTNGVQNEFLKILESDQASVFGDYGKYVSIGINNVLFVFAGAFNGEPDINIDKLRDFGVKTEFLGRVGLVFNTSDLSLEALYDILDHSSLLSMYLSLFIDVNRSEVVSKIRSILERNYTENTIGARVVNTLIHQYFIKGNLDQTAEDKTPLMFHTSLSLNK